MHASWKQFIVGVLLGIAALVAWFYFAEPWFAFIPLMFSLGLVTHAPAIMANGEHAPVPPSPPFRLSAWLIGTAQGLAIVLLGWFVGTRLWELISRKAPWIPAAKLRRRVDAV